MPDILNYCRIGYAVIKNYAICLLNITKEVIDFY